MKSLNETHDMASSTNTLITTTGIFATIFSVTPLRERSDQLCAESSGPTNRRASLYSGRARQQQETSRDHVDALNLTLYIPPMLFLVYAQTMMLSDAARIRLGSEEEKIGQSMKKIYMQLSLQRERRG